MTSKKPKDAVPYVIHTLDMLADIQVGFWLPSELMYDPSTRMFRIYYAHNPADAKKYSGTKHR